MTNARETLSERYYNPNAEIASLRASLHEKEGELQRAQQEHATLQQCIESWKKEELVWRQSDHEHRIKQQQMQAGAEQLLTKLERVRQERDALQVRDKQADKLILGLQKKREAAEQSRERMREALEKFVAAKEPNGYPLWFNRAVHECQKRPDRSACDSEDLCNKHWEMAHRDFTGCEKEIAEFVKALEGER